MGEYIYLIAPLSGWVVAQSIKFGLTLRKDGVTIQDAVQSGGMPSSHTAFMFALTTVVGLTTSISDIAFGITAAITGVIVYDALGVRRTTGQQTEAIKQLAKANKTKLGTIDNAKGHTLPEVVVGALVGIGVGIICYNVL
jgi:acid phosphatase family membrane protein YuiD